MHLVNSRRFKICGYLREARAISTRKHGSSVEPTTLTKLCSLSHIFPPSIFQRTSLVGKTHVLKMLQSRVLRGCNQRRMSCVAQQIDTIIRVDHAGELGADRIYAGQMAILGKSSVGPMIQHMWDQEKEHKAKFEELINKYRVRPTALIPIWNVAGFMLGAGSALLGPKAAMACTVAVESVIVEHYNNQLRVLMADPEKNRELLTVIQKFRDDEQEHHDKGLDEGAEETPFYEAFSNIIKFGCRAAISLSEVV